MRRGLRVVGMVVAGLLMLAALVIIAADYGWKGRLAFGDSSPLTCSAVLIVTAVALSRLAGRSRALGVVLALVGAALLVKPFLLPRVPSPWGEVHVWFLVAGVADVIAGLALASARKLPPS